METEPAGFFDLDPQQVAVLMVDFQNDFCSPDVFTDGPASNTHNTDAAHRSNAFAERAA